MPLSSATLEKLRNIRTQTGLGSQEEEEVLRPGDISNLQTLQQLGLEGEDPFAPKPSLLDRFVNIISRPVSGVAGAVESVAGIPGTQDPLTELFKGVAGQRKTDEGQIKTFQDTAKALGFSEESPFAGIPLLESITPKRAAGLAGDVFLDPLFFVKPVSLGSKAIKAGRAIPGVRGAIGAAEAVTKPITTAGRKAFGRPFSRTVSETPEGIKTEELLREIPARSEAEAVRALGKLGFEGIEQMPAEQRNLITQMLETRGIGEAAGGQLDLFGAPAAAKKFAQLQSKAAPETKTYFNQVETFLREAGEEQLERGAIRGLVPGYAKHLVTDNALREVDATKRGLIKSIFFKPAGISKTPQRLLTKGNKFPGTNITIKEGTIEELNQLSNKAFGYDLFETDVAKWLPKTVQEVTSNRVKEQVIGSIPDAVKGVDGEDIFLPIRSGENALPGHQKVGGVLGDVQAPTEVASQINAIEQILDDPRAISGIGKLVDKFHAIFKPSVTIPFPGFAGLNIVGGLFNNKIIGVDDASYFTARGVLKEAASGGQTAAKVYKAKTGATATAKQLVDEAENLGIPAGFIRSLIGRKALGTSPSLVEKGVDVALRGKFSPIRPLSAANEEIEQTLRFTNFFDTWNKTGDFRKAAANAFKAQGVYRPEYFTPFERDFMKRVVPFYSWMRANVPLQIENLLQRPGRLTPFLRTQQALTEPPTEEEKRFEPEFLKEAFGIKLPSKDKNILRKLTLQLPFLDIFNLEPKTLLSSVSPLIKVPAELIFNENLFFGNNIYDPRLPAMHPFQQSKAYPILKFLPEPLKKFVNFEEKEIDNPTGDGKVIKYSANPHAVYLLRNMAIPLTRLYSEAGRASEAVEEGNVFEAALETVSPFRIHEADIPQQRRFSEFELRERINKMISEARKRGLAPEAERGRAAANPFSVQGNPFIGQ